MRSSPLTLLAAACLTLGACADGPTEGLAPVGPLQMSVVGGNGQSGPPGTELPEALVVRVEDSRGHGVRGQIVNFRVVLGGGSVFAGAAITNRDGIARERWTLGAVGPQRLEARAVDGETGAALTFQVFTATIIDVAAPAATDVVAAPSPARIADPVRLTARISDVESGGSTIAGAAFNVNGGTFAEMQPVDGRLDSATEMMQATIAPLGIAGDYRLCVRGRDAANNTGAESCTTLIVLPPPPPAQLGISPASQDFGTVGVGSNEFRTFTVTNVGGVESGVVTEALTGANAADFSVSSSTCGATVGPSRTCEITVRFSPTASGSRSASITVSATPGGSASATLSGTGSVPAALAVSTTSLNFGNLNVGSSSATHTLTVGNTGGSPTGALNVGLTGPHATEFHIVRNGCATAQLMPGASCPIEIFFRPEAAGTRNATLTIASVPGGTVTVALMGSGIAGSAALTISPVSRDFGSVAVGSSSAPQNFTIQNTGTLSALSLNFVVTGLHAPDFDIVTSGFPPCVSGMTLIPAQSCTVTIVFGPSATGPRTASLTVSSPSAPAVPAGLSGIGGAASAQLTITPTSHSFGGVVVGTSAERVFTVTNIGSAVSGAVSVAVAGANIPEFPIETTTCGAALPPAGSCSVTVHFSPLSTGAKSVALSATASPGGTVNALLNGTGVDAALQISPTTQAFGSVLVGAVSSTVTLTVMNMGSVTSGPLSIVSSDPDFRVNGTTCVSPLAAGMFCNVTMTFAPLVAGAQSATLTVMASPGGTAVASLSGTGAMPATLTNAGALTLNFGNLPVGLMSAPQFVRVQNTGQTMTGVLATTLASPDYQITSDRCAGGPLAPGAFCEIAIVFRPVAPGPRPAELRVSANPGGVVIVSLQGTGN